MRLCNPDILIDWQAVPPPKFKKDYEGRLLRVLSFTRYTWQQGVDMPHDGSVCRVTRRFNSGGAGGFDLELAWHCPACDRAHSRTIPESWIAEGKAAFVEPVGLADATQALCDDRPALLYIATSYSHPEPAKRAARAALASQCAGWFMAAGYSVYSPLSMGHAITGECPDLKTDFATFREPCLRMLEMSDALVVLLLDGMHESIGVAAEIDHARKLGIPLNQVRLPGPGAVADNAPFEIVPNPRWWR